MHIYELALCSFKSLVEQFTQFMYIYVTFDSNYDLCLAQNTDSTGSCWVKILIEYVLVVLEIHVAYVLVGLEHGYGHKSSKVKIPRGSRETLLHCILWFT